ncbi:fimbrillin family protein [Bacteroides caecigallinarum]|nr:fimbrillin family protein [Bacteroides caecigallinarum]
MNNRLPLHILSAATVLLFAATACTRDDLGGGTLPEGEYPLVIRATGLQAVATPASRATVDGDWQGVQTVALSVGGTVKEYDVTASDADGYKTATLSSDTDPFWWTSREDITVSAWWPYGTTMPDVVVKEDQSTKEGFEGSDFISAEAQAVQFDHPMLEFSHRTARITVLLKPGDGIPSVTGANVSVTGLGTDNGNPATIRTYAAGSDTYEALTAPQTVKANTPFIQVDLGGGTFYFRPKNDMVLKANSRYTYTVNVTAKGLELAGCTIGDWANGGDETGNAEDLGYSYDSDTHTYSVYTPDGLMEWNEAAQNDPLLNCTLTTDIDLTGKEWTPIGRPRGYTGTFDGQGHTITGLNISPSEDAAALFHQINGDGTVMNLQLKDVTYNGVTAMGGIAHGNYGTITACSVTGTLTNTTNNGHVGGIAATNLGTITACWFSGTITGGSSIGGIAGSNTNAGSYNGKITACYWSGEEISNGVGYDVTGNSETTKVEGNWTDAIDGMNAALTDNAYQWTSGTDGLPVLKKK